MVLNRFVKHSQKSEFPPYHLLHQSWIKRAEKNHAKLEKIYFQAQRNTWDNKAVLSQLLEKHGGIKIPREQKQALANIFSIILWGELAAWIISAELTEAIEDVEAKMAAASQTFDEARHFYVIREYLMHLDIEIPPLGPYNVKTLRAVLETSWLPEKLLGMQLLVETVALAVFQSVRESNIEPVLCGLMPYIERDEARHVGLGVQYLPILAKQFGILDTFRLYRFQQKLNIWLMVSSLLQERDFRAVGIEPLYLSQIALKKQNSALRELVKSQQYRGGIIAFSNKDVEQATLLTKRLFTQEDTSGLSAFSWSILGIIRLLYFQEIIKQRTIRF